MITATLSGTEPAPQEIQYPILMKDKRDGQIMLILSRDTFYNGIALTNSDNVETGEDITLLPERLEVYHGEITLKNS